MGPIRLAHLGDAVALARIESAAWREAYRHLLHPSVLTRLDPETRVPHWRDRLRRAGRQVAVVEADGRVVGYVTFGSANQGDLEPGLAGEVFELYIHPSHQRQGLGQHLLAWTWRELYDLGFYWGVVEVLAGNAPARAFYAATGLQTDERPRHRGSGARGDGGAVQVIRYETPLHPDLR